jgi:PAS domain S-box-containing protein
MEPRAENDVTEGKSAEEALRESERQYRAVVMAMTEGIVFQAANGAITAVNPAAERIEGRSAEQMISHTSDNPQWRAIYEDGRPFPGELHPSMVTLRTGEPQSDVVMGIHKPDGALVWISINSQPLKSPGESKPYAVVTTFHDITERKKADELHRKSEEQYRILFEESFDGLFITSPGGQILDMNKKGVMMFGYDTKEEMLSLDLGRDVYEKPEDRKRILALVNTLGTAEYEVAVKKKNGEKMVTRCSLTAVKNEGGEVTAYRGIIHDITEGKRAEEELSRARTLLEALMENIPDNIYFKDLQSRHIRTSRSHAMAFHLSDPSEAIGRPISISSRRSTRELPLKTSSASLRAVNPSSILKRGRRGRIVLTHGS